ncbi:hypothetical protein [Sporosarcina ureae]|uniref:hypothetical protein n=1 Tax=Sporosarcina ureae TaxID=1571 RepID=UPI0026EA21BC|nr:hypothetical protein [Sporosarcina ureae]
MAIGITFKDEKCLHIYAQEFPHDGALIVGNKLALLELRRAIDEALKGRESKGHLTASDGEGYRAYVFRIEDDERELFESLEMPYITQYGDVNSHMYFVNGGKENKPPNPIGILWERK